MTDRHLRRTDLLNFDATAIRDLIMARGWATLSPFERIGAAYDFVATKSRSATTATPRSWSRGCCATATGQVNGCSCS